MIVLKTRAQLYNFTADMKSSKPKTNLVNHFADCMRLAETAVGLFQINNCHNDLTLCWMHYLCTRTSSDLTFACNVITLFL